MRVQRIPYSVTFIVLLSLNAYSKDTTESYEMEDVTHTLPADDPHRITRAAAKNDIILWPNATIPFIIDVNFNETEKSILLEIMEEWINETCVKFTHFTGPERYFIFFFKTTQQLCFSKTGLQWQEPMPQFVYINPRCLSEARRFMSHELGHLFGFFHEHNRPDRDKYIEIVWENVQKNKEEQFKKKTKDEVFSFGSPYDFGSIMQYPLDYYSVEKGKPTMKPRVKYNGPVGTRMRPSQMDKQQLKYLYGCETYTPSSGSGEFDNYLPLDYDSTFPETPEATPVLLDHPTQTQSDYQIHYSTTSLTSTPMIGTLPVGTATIGTSSASTQLACISSTSTSLISTPMISSSMITTSSSISSSFSIPLLSPPPSFQKIPVSTVISSTVVISTSMTGTLTINRLPTGTPTDIYSKSPLPTPQSHLTGHDGVLQSGNLVGLKAQFTSKNYWFTCGIIRCSLKRCPGRSFNEEKQQECLSSKFRLLKLNNQSDIVIHVGDKVVLMPNDSNKTLVACGSKGICKLKHDCLHNDQIFSSFCSKHLLTLHVPGKTVGMEVKDGDLVELRHDKTLSNRTRSWLGCDPLGKMKCKRYYCSDDGSRCDYERFRLCIL